jgi:hypothetical protein
MRTSIGVLRAVRALPSFGAAVAALGLAVATTSCAGGGGGGGNGAAKPMVLTEFLFVDRALHPSFPTGVQALPRNAQIVFQFSELVDPSSINDQTIQLRFGAQFQSIPKGSLQVDGDRVIFDPTLTAQGTPNPFGLDPVTQYVVELPAAGDQNAVVENLDNDPLLTSFLTTFTTSDGYLRELVPPEVLSLTWVPAQNPFTKQIPGGGFFVLDFSEAMDPASFIQATGPTVQPNETIDVRYSDLSPDPNINNPTAAPTGGVENTAIPGTFIHDPAAKKWSFIPTFSFGDKKYVLTISLRQGLTDLSGNLLVNPRSFGPYTVDGTGSSPGRLLAETFDDQTNNDITANPGSAADWGSSTPGTLQGAAISTREVFTPGYAFAELHQGGQYNAVAEPLTGANLGPLLQSLGLPAPTPATSLGRRVMSGYRDVEMGQNGTVTTASWGPDSNATFAAQYPDVTLRIGFQKTASISLATTFSGNYLGNPLIFYKGTYSVNQAANVGNRQPIVRPTTPYTNIGTCLGTNCSAPPQSVVALCANCNNPNYGCYSGAVPQPVLLSGTNQQAPPTLVNMMDCLYIYTGYVDWPAPTSYFDWDEGDPTIDDDVVMVWDASAMEGDIFQAFRLFYAVTAPNNGIPISGFPLRRMYATYEEDDPNPPSNFVAGIQNPEWSVVDNAFTLTKRVSIAQVRFFTPVAGDPSLNPAGQVSGINTFGTLSDYHDALITPTVQEGGAGVLIEYQGATALDPTGARNKINVAFAFTPFTTSVDDCDTFPYIRWRLTLTANLTSQKVAKVLEVSIPVVEI